MDNETLLNKLRSVLELIGEDPEEAEDDLSKLIEELEDETDDRADTDGA
jgi:hypothetical protein